MKSIGDSFRSPIAIFLYNRPKSAMRLFDCLFESPLFRQSTVYVFIDGPKDNTDIKNVDLVKKSVLNIDHPDLRLHLAEHNKGLKASIMDGVTLVCEKHDSVIVLEDDLELSPFALEYFNGALMKYFSISSIYSVSGYLPGPGLHDVVSRAIVLPYAHSWGWATWSRAWAEFKIDPECTKDFLKSKVFRDWFNLGGLRDYAEMLALANRQALDSWYVYWLFHIFRNRGISIFPPKSYVRNLGSRGTHSSPLNPLNLVLSRKDLCEELVEFPDRVDIDFWALDVLGRTVEARVQRISGWVGSIKRKVLLKFRV